MRFSLLLMAWAVLGMTPADAADLYARFFTGSTMRIDLHHTGTKGEERLALDQVYEEGAWPGSQTQLLDTLNLGEYFVRVSDRATNMLIYSRGYSTIFNEWQTTDEAVSGAYRTFEESVRLPYPRKAVQVSVSRRDKRMMFHEIFTTIIDPQDPTQVHREKMSAPYAVRPLMQNGDPAKKVDILILGDGYAQGDLEKFRKDAARFSEGLFSTKPFAGRRKDFNVWTMEVVAGESGVDIPDQNVWKRNPLGTMYNTFGSARYCLTTDNRVLRDIAAAAPYDFICILVNESRYGGGGIFNLYATCYTDEKTASQQWQMDYVFVHEFGHSFGGLGDEYYNSSVAYTEFYPAGVEPWEPNVTALRDPANIKWKAFVTAGTPVPTPWEKASFDSVETLRGKLDRLAADYYEKREPLYRASTEILRTSKFVGKVGAFEGSGYASTGLYRPAVDCRMFSLKVIDFDPVCSAAIERMIDLYTR